MKQILRMVLLAGIIVFSGTNTRLEASKNLLQDDEILKGEYLIRNQNFKEFLYVSDKYKKEGDWALQGSPSISKNSIFTFKKDAGGSYLIKSKNRGGNYLFLAADRIDGDRVTEAKKKIEARSSFEIEYVKSSFTYRIKNKSKQKYLFLSKGGSRRREGDRVVQASDKIKSKSYFEIIPYTKDYFK